MLLTTISKNDKISLFASIGADFNFLYLNSAFVTAIYPGSERKTGFASMTVKSEKEIYGSHGYNVFNPALTASIGIDIKAGEHTAIRLEPNIKYSVRPYGSSITKDYYFNYGINVAYLLYR